MISHSTGSSIILAAMSMNPDFYRECIKCYIAIAPIVRIGNTTSKIIKKSCNILVKKFIDQCGPEI